jgi:hypothetical protein
LLIAHKKVEDFLLSGKSVPPQVIANLEKAIAAVEFIR